MLLTIDSDSIKPSEVVARYLLSSSDYGNSRVKPRALEPSPSDHCTSVFRIDELTENEVWDMGTRLVAAPRARRVHARVDINVSSILKVDLSVRSDEPPVRHALIYGWSTEKHARMAKAQELAAQTSLKLKT